MRRSYVERKSIISTRLIPWLLLLSFKCLMMIIIIHNRWRRHKNEVNFSERQINPSTHKRLMAAIEKRTNPRRVPNVLGLNVHLELNRLNRIRWASDASIPFRQLKCVPERTIKNPLFLECWLYLGWLIIEPRNWAKEVQKPTSAELSPLLKRKTWNTPRRPDAAVQLPYFNIPNWN